MRIGMLGGMFDPVHIGHLRPALEFHARLALDELRLVPCATPGHRETAALPAEERVALVEAAIADIDGIVVDDRELKLPPPSYTVQTLRDMHAENGEASYILGMGEDAFRGFCRWKEWEAILDLADIVVMHRPGTAEELDPEVATLLESRRVALEAIGKQVGRIATLEVTPLAVSSTAIRAMLARGEDPKFLVPEAVRQRILDNRYYMNGKAG
ncbi:MAG: nicotinate-nucleotide adenylyltransferase [Gammaproteobacteria bacterium]|nr:nicotinate-nucleotide adenylyltransferase [Gammaproteobacteria bacterium]